MPFSSEVIGFCSDTLAWIMRLLSPLVPEDATDCMTSCCSGGFGAGVFFEDGCFDSVKQQNSLNFYNKYINISKLNCNPKDMEFFMLDYRIYIFKLLNRLHNKSSKI